MNNEHWNHNTQYHPVLLAALPHGARSALDIGCGEGLFARKLRGQVPSVTGLDLDEEALARAKGHGDDITYVTGDAMTHPLADSSFDVVTAVALLHWLDTESGLRRLASLVAPGGMLGVVGLGRRNWREAPYDAVGFFAHRLLARRYGVWDPQCAVANPTDTHTEVREIARRVLPGVEYRHHVLFRHTLVWRKPAS